MIFNYYRVFIFLQAYVYATFSKAHANELTDRFPFGPVLSG